METQDKLAKVERYLIFMPSAQLDIMIYIPPSFPRAVCVVLCVPEEKAAIFMHYVRTRMSCEALLIFRARKRNTPMLFGGGRQRKKTETKLHLTKSCKMINDDDDRSGKRPKWRGGVADDVSCCSGGKPLGRAKTDPRYINIKTL